MRLEQLKKEIGVKYFKIYFLLGVIVALFALSVSLSFAMGSRPGNPCAKKMKNSCNPCAGKPKNVCNPCAKKMMNPCGKKDMHHIRSNHITDYSELTALGKKLWSDEKLGTSGLNCMSCHEDNELLNLDSAGSFPHYIEMAKDILTLDQMINFCLINPMEGEKLDSDSIKMTALAAYYNEYKKSYKMENPCNPHSKKMVNPCNPCAKKRKNVCNPCGK